MIRNSLAFAKELDGDEDELLLMAERTPIPIPKRVLQRPGAFRALASYDDRALNRLLQQINALLSPQRPTAMKQ